MSAFEYIKANVAHFKLTSADVAPLIEGTNLSFSAIAQLTSMTPRAVAKGVRTGFYPSPDPEIPRVGIDGKPALGGRPRTKVIEVVVPDDEYANVALAARIFRVDPTWLSE